jgi:hypothetical protein
MTYQQNLPSVFPYTIKAPLVRVREWVAFLVESSDENERMNAPRGSSFAITSDTDQKDFRNVWLSTISVLRLAEAFDYYGLKQLAAGIEA